MVLKVHQDDFWGDGHERRSHTWVHRNHTRIRGSDDVDR